MAIRVPFIGKTNPNGQADPPYSGSAPTQPLDQLVGHTAQEQDPGIVRPRISQPPIGQSGRANFYGLPEIDEHNPKLAGITGLRTLDEMYRTDAHIRRLILAAWSPVTAGTWALEPYGGEDATDQDRQIADTVWWMLTQWMSPNFYEHLHTLGPMLLRFGFTPFEQLWAPCKYQGKTLLGPRKLDPRLPKTIWRWWQDDWGELTYIGQILPNRPDVVIPATELTYYRLGAEGDNWQGTSLLRHAYKHWFIKDRLERIDMIGQERKAVGVPIVYHSTDVDTQALNDLETAVANMHTSEVAYLMVPGRKMGTSGTQGIAGTKEFLIDVIQFDSSSGDSIKSSIEYHQTAISASFLTDFLELGHHQVGARATAEVQEDPFLTAVNGALLPPLMAPLNALVDRIVKVNWDGAQGSPTLKLTLHDDASLTEISSYVQQLAMSDPPAINVDADLEDWLRERAGLPPANQQARAAKEAVDDAQREAQLAGAKASAADPGGLKAAAAAAAKVPPDGDSEPPNPDNPPTKPTPKPAAKPPSKQLDTATAPVAAGLIVQADDTGRVLMIQRSDDKHDDDDTRARWEFPGGKPDDGDEGPYETGRREWQEETGAKLPASAKQVGSFTSPDGKYQGFGLRIAHEADLTLGQHDPNEVAAVQWWEPADLATDHRVRGKVQQSLPDIHRLLNTDDAKQLDTGKPIVWVDLDGTLRHGTGGDPLPGAADGMRKLADDYQVVICTANPDLPGVRRWLGQHGFGQFAASVTHEKPRSVAGIDNEVIHFDGDWSTVPGRVAKQAAKQLDGDGPRVIVLDAAAEPTVRWFERLLSQDRLRDAFTGARDHVEAAVGPAALLAARQLAHQAANGASVAGVQPPAELVDALTRHYTDLYQLGHQTVQTELARQRSALGKQLDDPVDIAAGAAGLSRLGRARQRGEHSARNIVNKIGEVLGRQQITGLKTPAALQTTAEKAATGQLHIEALSNAAPMISDGRHDAAMADSGVVGAYVTSVMDERSCDPCVASDDGKLLSPDEAITLGPPNPNCLGGDYCRCMLVWVLSSDPAAAG